MASRSTRPGAEPDERGDREAPRQYFDPYHDALACGARAACAQLHVKVRAVRSALHPIARAPALRWRAAELQHRHEQRRELLATLTAAIEAACSGRGFTHVTNGRFKGGWTTRHYGDPERGRSRRADGARLPRLHDRARRTFLVQQLASCLRPGEGRACCAPH